MIEFLTPSERRSRVEAHLDRFYREYTELEDDYDEGETEPTDDPDDDDEDETFIDL